MNTGTMQTPTADASVGTENQLLKSSAVDDLAFGLLMAQIAVALVIRVQMN